MGDRLKRCAQRHDAMPFPGLPLIT